LRDCPVTTRESIALCPLQLWRRPASPCLLSVGRGESPRKGTTLVAQHGTKFQSKVQYTPQGPLPISLGGIGGRYVCKMGLHRSKAIRSHKLSSAAALCRGARRKLARGGGGPACTIAFCWRWTDCAGSSSGSCDIGADPAKTCKTASGGGVGAQSVPMLSRPLP
jgi:hypothetical protein